MAGGHRGNEEALDRWATETGEGEAKFGWGADGDFDRCVAFMEDKGLGTEEAKGHCANLHHRALGVWPGREHKKAEDTIMATAVGWAPIVKSEKTADGTLIITGKAADSTLDRDYQIADPGWLDTAMSKWFGEPDGGNIREQHDGKRAIGTAVHYEKGEDGGHYVKAEIVDPVAILKIEKNVLKGFSWSARNAATKKDPKAPGGRIVKGDIYELSVVDRPANPGCLIQIAKADGNGDLQVVEEPAFVEVVEVDKADDGDTPLTKQDFIDALMSLGKRKAPAATTKADDDKDGDADGGDGDGEEKPKPPGHKPKPYRSDEKDTVKCPNCDRMNAPDAKHCDQCGYKLKGNPDVKAGADARDDDSDDASKADLPMFGEELRKFVSAKDRDRMADSGVAMPNGDFPIPDEGHLKSAVGHYATYNGDKAAAKAHIIKRAKALGLTKLLPDDWTAAAKAVAGSVAVLRKALAEHGITLTKDDGALDEPDEDELAEVGEAEDIGDGKAAIAAIARLIISEAQSLATGRLDELFDIQMLCQAASALRFFIDHEADETEYLVDPKADDVTETTADNGDTTTKTDDENTEGTTDVGVLTKADLSELLDETITKAVQPYKDELEVVKGELAKVLATPRPDGPARTRTTTQKAVATKADAIHAEIRLCRERIETTSGDLKKGYRERLAVAEKALAELDGAA